MFQLSGVVHRDARHLVTAVFFTNHGCHQIAKIYPLFSQVKCENVFKLEAQMS